MVKINATIWCELYVDSWHRMNNEDFYKLLEVFNLCDKLSDNVCMERSHVGWGSALQGQSDLGEASSGHTEISPFKMDTKALFIACWLADLIKTSVSSSLIALRSSLWLYHHTDCLKNLKLCQTSH